MRINTVISISTSVLSRALEFLNDSTQHGNPHSSDNYEHDEIQRSFKVTPGDRIEVSGIGGPVEVETIDGDMAEVHIIRSAKVKDDLAWNKLRIEQLPTGLIIEAEDEPRRPRTVRVNHYIALKLPRRTNFSAVGVSGSISIAAIDGEVQVSGCSGSVIMKETNGPTDISGVSGAVILNVTRLSDRGLQINGVSGAVELHLSDKLDAELSVTNVSGGVFIDLPNQEPRRSGHHYRLGKGGPRIFVGGVSGSVVVRLA